MIAPTSLCVLVGGRKTEQYQKTEHPVWYRDHAPTKILIIIWFVALEADCSKLSEYTKFDTLSWTFATVGRKRWMLPQAKNSKQTSSTSKIEVL